MEVRQATVQLRSGNSAMAWSTGKGTSVPITAAVWRRRSSGGSRSMRANTACTVAAHVQGIERLRQTIGPWCPDQDARLHQRAHALFQKERIALGAGDQQRRKGRQTAPLPSSAWSNACALTGGRGSSRSCV